MLVGGSGRCGRSYVKGATEIISGRECREQDHLLPWAGGDAGGAPGTCRRYPETVKNQGSDFTGRTGVCGYHLGEEGPPWWGARVFVAQIHLKGEA